MEGASASGRWPARTLGWSAVVAASLAAGCSPYIGTTASSYLRRVREDPDPNIRYLAYGKLAQPQCYDSPAQRDEAVRVLVDKLNKGAEPLATRATILRTLGELRSPLAREVVLRATNDPEAVIRVQACRALGRVGKAEDATVLARVMAVDTLEDCRIAAIDALGDLKPDDPRITRTLVNGMRHDDPATRLASLNALRKLTGKDLGTDAVAWEALLPKGDDPKVNVAAAGATAAAAGGGTYPPRPRALRAVLDSATELAGKVTATQKARAPEEQGANFARPAAAADPNPSPSAGQPGYPATNPNLPAPAR